MEQQEMEQLNDKDEIIKKLKSENLKLKRQIIDLQKAINSLMKFVGGEQ